MKNKKILLGITGSIAAYKSPVFVRELIKEGALVKVMMTPSAKHFVSSMVLQNLTRNPVAWAMFGEETQSGGAWHIELAHWCDALIIAPCTATTLGKLAHGICDNALTTVATALPRDIPCLIAPAMDSTMWLNPATQRNVNILKNDGYMIIPPAEGELSSGLKGPGRLPEISVLADYLRKALDLARADDTNENISSGTEKKNENHGDDNTIEVVVEKRKKSYEEQLEEVLSKPSPTLEEAVQQDKWNAELEFSRMKEKANGMPEPQDMFKGKKILITAGPTYEKIDDVRFIGNFSSGKMGYALAYAAQSLGAEVTLVSGPVSVAAPEGIKKIDVVSAKDMYDSVIKEYPACDIAVLSAAVADYTPKSKVSGKIKKETNPGGMSLELEETKDILAALGSDKKKGKFLVGFALESVDEIENGWKKLQKKNADMIVVNTAGKPGSGFGGDDNTITILTRDGSRKDFPRMSKVNCAYAILERIAEATGLKNTNEK